MDLDSENRKSMDPHSILLLQFGNEGSSLLIDLLLYSSATETFKHYLKYIQKEIYKKERNISRKWIFHVLSIIVNIKEFNCLVEWKTFENPYFRLWRKKSMFNTFHEFFFHQIQLHLKNFISRSCLSVHDALLGLDLENIQ